MVYVESYGCTHNRSEAIEFGEAMRHSGISVNSDGETDDTVVIFTCTVITATENHMIRRIRQLLAEGKKVIVAGCMAEVQEKLLKKMFGDRIIITGISSYGKNYSGLKTDVLKIINKKSNTGEKFKATTSNQGNYAYPIAISQGCLGNCSYCITKFARGNLVTYDENVITEKLKKGLNQNIFEINITSQDTGVYGMDLDGRPHLTELIEKLSYIEGNYMMRIGMMNPFGFLLDREAFVKMYSLPHVFRFAHIPVQSGNNDILKMMKRPYTVENFLDIINDLRGAYPDITISTDIIVGFPGETEETFNDSIDLIKRIKPSVLNITRFSARPGTEAAVMKDNIPGSKLKEWSRHLTSIFKKISTEENEKYLGRNIWATVTEHVKKGTSMLRDINYKPIIVKKILPVGKTVNVRITGCTPSYLIGVITDEQE